MGRPSANVTVKQGTVVVFTQEEYPERAAALLAELIRGTVSKQGRCSVALAGGSTPIPVYRALSTGHAALATPWDRVDVYFGDERAVPPGHRESNYGAARVALLSPAGIPAGNVHPMDALRADREGAARDYEARLPERIDLLLLGMGSDGHTASLFPGSPALEEGVRRVVAVTSPKPPPGRMTITPPVIAAAGQVVMMVTGGEKSAMVSRVLKGTTTPAETPAVLALAGIWVLDRPAASKLGRDPVGHREGSC
jgi:6-phosphogluconolactonase